MQKIVPFLWFDGQAEEATNFYISVFKDSKLISAIPAPENAPGVKGKIFGTKFQLEGQAFMALNGGPMYKFTPAISLYVNCTTQEEVDDLWNKLTADGGKESRCGWLVDKFGVSWQIIPVQLGQLMGDPDQLKAQKTMQAMMQMVKIDIAALQQAHDS